MKKRTGKSTESAIIVESVREEYEHIEKILKLGKPGELWNVKKQGFLSEDNKSYDVMEVELFNGTFREFYFDISSFF
jgi:hypothetical protein